ncbi:MAG TPA: Kdo hydroxylase family protein [Caulobacteraceae bacterium]|nr:Kdo hydroxylase family protein [Caulobacteraceae bacterium]
MSAQVRSDAIRRGGHSASKPADAPVRVGGEAAPLGDLRMPLEREGVLVIDTSPFRLTEAELRLTGRRWGDGRSKNVSYDPRSRRVDGTFGGGDTVDELRALMARYAQWCQDLIARLFPGYEAAAELGRTSFRPRSVLERPRSRRKDDRRLHVDAFTSQPVAGRRILRVFSNVDPSGASRDWAVGDGFEDYARRFLRRARRLLPGEAALLHALTLTKERRTDYDQIMLSMHDAAKGDRTYQRTAPRRAVSFPPGATWVAFTDQSPHAVTGGQCALEQTFYLPIEALADPDASPLRVLERLCGAPLI